MSECYPKVQSGSPVIPMLSTGSSALSRRSGLPDSALRLLLTRPHARIQLRVHEVVAPECGERLGTLLPAGLGAPPFGAPPAQALLPLDAAELN